MKNNYSAPEVEMILSTTEDVVTASGDGYSTDVDFGNTWTEPEDQGVI